ncbi:DUF4917 family protein [Aquirufa nivalisilvae]|uniref:DUF4917 family protein n=1 Tax=Aquirufa nivalisilvae TaxID=2516557 RepID=UPI001032E4A1|nr:DUF4917 family protein [Aquirufa nivalisilvae]TBH76270.1 DUF4917 family protein [Aquirufa nivalisilvae]
MTKNIEIALKSFNEALKEAEVYTKKHLLLGNGFSIACVSSIFSYKSLYKNANFDDIPEVKDIFKRLGTEDFEIAIKGLENGAKVLPVYYKDDSKTAQKIVEHTKKLKEKLIETIAENHPKYPSEIEESKFLACEIFLKHFLQSKGYIFYLNYDLLLYWTLMHFLDKKDDEKTKIELRDGFGKETWLEGAEIEVNNYLSWLGKSNDQNIHYLHGALHLYKTDTELVKFSWLDQGISLIKQAKMALQESRFPLFVSEGDSDKKLNKINETPYLHYSYDSFKGVLCSRSNRKAGNTCMFTFGFSFSDNDKHIFSHFATGKIKHLFVGIFGDHKSKENQMIISKVNQLKESRSKNEPLKITYYSAESAEVWG